MGEAMAVDGDRLAIGLPMDAVTTLGGVVEIFDRDAGTGAWGRTARVEISGSAVGGILSSGMIGLDGDRVVFGNWNDDSAGPRTGAVSVMDRDPITGAFAEQQLLRASDAASGHAFGMSAATDGQVIVVGAPLHNGSGSYTGALYFFERDASGQWVEVQQILGSTTGVIGVDLGRHVTFEGRELIARSLGQEPQLHVLRKDSMTGVWALHQTLLSPALDDPYYGLDFVLDGNRMVVVGGDAFSSTRKVYIYEKPVPHGDWVPMAVIDAPGITWNFAFPVALDGDRIACRSTEPGPTGNSVRLYRRNAVTGVWDAQRLLPPSVAGSAVGIVHSGLAIGNARLFNGDRFAENSVGAVFVHDLEPDCDNDGWADPCQVLARPDDDLDLNGQVDSCELSGFLLCDPAASNSTGQPGRLVPLGSDILANQSLTLYLDNLPSGPPGYMLVSQEAGFVPNAGGSVGDLCIFSATSFGRFASMIMNANAAGRLTFNVPLSALPQPNGTVVAQLGETWYFQYWHRDWSLSTPLSNLTNAVGITLR
ncbi:MAG: hypothetical protein ACJA2W_003523 [Planctomycetota bacterium]|jgi:hypothetical protein